MARFTIEVADSAVPALQALAARYNADNGSALALEEYLELHVAEMSIQEEFAARVEQLQKEIHKALEAAVLAERDRLLDGARPRTQ